MKIELVKATPPPEPVSYKCYLKFSKHIILLGFNYHTVHFVSMMEHRIQLIIGIFVPFINLGLRMKVKHYNEITKQSYSS